MQIKSVGNLTGEMIKFIDTIPSGTTFVNGSLTIDGVSSSESLNTGIMIGDIVGIDNHTVTFKVIIK